MRVRVKTAKGNEVHGRAPYPNLFPLISEERDGDEGDSRWYVEVSNIEDLAVLIGAASQGHQGAVLSPPSRGGSFASDDGDCGLVLTVWDDYLE